jgi:anti-anti-sigma factor
MAEPANSVASLTNDDDPDELLRVSACRHGDACVVLSAYGELDLSNIWMIESELSRFEHVPRLIIDLSGLGFCGVSGARLLHSAVTRSVVTGQQVQVVQNAVVARLLEATGLSGEMPMLRQADLDADQAERGCAATLTRLPGLRRPRPI